jgi:hypothetical protein
MATHQCSKCDAMCLVRAPSAMLGFRGQWFGNSVKSVCGGARALAHEPSVCACVRMRTTRHNVVCA